MLRTRKKKIPALGVALVAAVLLLFGVAMLGNGAFAGFLIAGGLFGMVYCAYFMGQRGFHSEIEVDASFYCYGDEPCGHQPNRPKNGCLRDDPCAHRCPGPSVGEPAGSAPSSSGAGSASDDAERYNS